MPKRKDVRVQSLHLDLHNFRTVIQPDEISAIHAMIAIEPDRLWALMESLLDDGFTLAENVLVRKSGRKLIVAEGNRRVAAMKLALGLIDHLQFALPAHIVDRIATLSSGWRTANAAVPCVVYAATEADACDRAVALIHGKGEKAGRDSWASVAKARHSRDKRNQAQIDLDLLESYLANGKNASNTQKERWAGDYPLTVLDEAIKKIAPRLGFKSGREFVSSYPKNTAHRAQVEQVLCDIGSQSLGFKELRNTSDDVLLRKYGIPAPKPQGTGTSTTPSGNPSGAGTTGPTPGLGSGTGSGGASPQAGGPVAGRSGRRPLQSHPLSDYRAVKRAIKGLHIKHGGREKVTLLRNELANIDLRVTPHAFCFVLRSVFEISAKAYCDDHKMTGGPSTQKSGGMEKKLVDLLRDIVGHLTKNNSDAEMKKRLTGAMAELGKTDGFLSVVSMNQLVHNRSFNINETHICGLFFNILPLIEEMNA